MADSTEKCIGRLTLDIEDVSKKIEDVNKFLGQIGANVNLEDKLSKKISSALNNLVNEARKAGEEAQKAISKGLSADVNVSVYEKMEQKVLAAENKMREEADKTLAKMEQRAEKEAAAAERSAERQRAAHEREQRRHEEVFRKEELAAERTTQKTEQMYTQMFDRIRQQEEKRQQQEERQRSKQTDQYTLMYIKQEQEALNSIIKQYQEYYEWKTKAIKSESNGDQAGADLFTQNAHQAYEEIQRLTELYPDLIKVAEASNEVNKAQTAWLNAITSTSAKESLEALAKADAEAAREEKANADARKQAIQDYAKALVTLYNEQAKLNNSMASGKIREGTEEYDAVIDKIKHMQEAVNQTGAALDSEGQKMAESMQNVVIATDNLYQSEARLNDSGQDSWLEATTTAYNRLKEAVNQYSIAKKAQNEQGMTTWQTEIEKQMQIITSIEETIGSLSIEEGVREQILTKIEQAKTLQDGFQKGVVGTTSATNELAGQINGILTRYLSLMAVIRSISNLIQNTVEYVSEYSNKMSEIQMITLKTDEEVEKLADTYRQLAADMNVSSLDMADAAIYFTRQGLGAAEIEKRLKNVTMYAKAANVEFRDAAEIITAVVNSMDLVEQAADDGRNATQRVADVFLTIGDNAATSGQEIGDAMQKASASAGAFGVSMEWLAAYIAAVSETTRQEARTIGTALNTIIARLHQIKQKGYNEEDETKINDVAKALANIDVALMDQQGNWRDMEDIFIDISDQWSDLDDKTKSYIATTMAGVKQQNVFLALMNDMAKSVDDNSRAFQLHELAMHSDGAATEKYGVYLDSVAASQEKLNIAQEKFYALLDQSVIKSWNNLWADFLNMITRGAEAINGLNIIIPVVLAGIAGIAIAIHGVNLKLKETITLTAMLEKHPIMMAIGAAVVAGGALMTVISGIVDVIGSSKKRFNEASQAIEEHNKNIQEATKIQKSFASLQKDVQDNTELSNAQLQKYSGLLDSLEDISAKAKLAVLSLKNGFGDQTEQVEILNQEIETYLDNQHKLMALEGIKKYTNYQSTGPSYNFASTIASNWGDFSSLEEFAQRLQYHYEHSKPDFDSVLFGYDNSTNVNHMPEDVRNQITEWKKELQKIYGDQPVENMWEEIAQLVWQTYFGGDASYNISAYLADEVNSAIDDAMGMVGHKLNPVDYAVLRGMLSDMIFGPDGEIDASEYKDFSAKITSFISDMIEHDFDPSAIELPKESKIAEYISNLWKNMGDNLSDDLKQSITDFYGQDSDLADALINGLSEMIDAGYTEEDIYDTLFGKPVSEWNEALEMFRQDVENGLRDLLVNPAQGEAVDEYFAEMLDSLLGDLDLSSLKQLNDIISSLAEAGVDSDQIKEVIQSSESIEQMFQSLKNLQAENGIVIEEESETALKSLSEVMKALKSTISDIKDMDDVLKKLKAGKAVDFDDLLNLVGAHPELAAVIHDTEEFKKKLEEIRNATKEDAISNVMSFITGDEEFMRNSKFAQYMTDEIKTLDQYIATLDEEDAEYQAVQEELNKLRETMVDWTTEQEDTSKQTKALTTDVKDAKQEIEKLDNMISQLKDGKEIKFSDLIDLSLAHPQIFQAIGDTQLLLQTLEEVRNLSMDNLGEKISDMMWRDADVAAAVAQVQGYDLLDNETLEEYKNRLELQGEDTTQLVTYINECIEALKKAREEYDASTEAWLQAQAEKIKQQQELNAAESEGFQDQVNTMRTDLSVGGTEGAQQALDTFNALDEKMKESIAKTYPNMIVAAANLEKVLKDEASTTEDVVNATKAFERELEKTQKYAKATHFTELYDASKKLAEGTMNVTEAYETLNKEVNNMSKAYEDIQDVENKMSQKTNVTVNDVANLAKVLNMSAEDILDDWPAAVAMFDELTGSTGAFKEALDMLNEAAFIRITGTSEADFSAIQDGLISTQGMAEETIKLLEATGQWTVKSMTLNTEAWVQHGTEWVKEFLSGTQDILVPTGSNPFARNTSPRTSGSHSSGGSGGSGGGGGGGGGSGQNDSYRDTNITTEIEKMLDLMSQIQKIQQWTQNYYQSMQQYYASTGQIQGVIAYMEKEKEALEEQNKTLQENVKRIEAQIAAKRAELNALALTDAAYSQVADDLEKLQSAYYSYTTQIVNNQTAINNLNNSIEEQENKINQMEIDVENEIYQAILDRENKKKEKLQAEIQMENTIMDVIKKRYEKERDEIIQTTQMKIDALEKEKELLSEQLRIRKEQKEETDKMLELEKLEAKYQRIIADPTRAKEAQTIRDEIDKLREEMAWDVAEKEVEAQQDSIDQQITSLEDYVEYVENYYNDLFEHPQQLIKEMREIMKMSQDEIIEWLKQNDENYQNSSKKTQQQMEQSWRETHDKMKGKVKDYWKEVEEIIAKGDDYIIEFLKKHSSKYKEASKKQAEAYINEWKKKLEELKKAHEQVTAQIANTYPVVPTGGSSGNGSGGGSGGGGSGSGGGGVKDLRYGYTTTDSRGYPKSEGGTVYAPNETSAKTKAKEDIQRNGWKDRILERVYRYANGGLAKQTGFAWLDGTEQNPERVLNPYQTKLFESMVTALQRIDSIPISIPDMNGMQTGNSNQVSVGDIIVNVDNLDTDEDYEELARKVGEVLMEEIGKTAVIGGLHIRSN